MRAHGDSFRNFSFPIPCSSVLTDLKQSHRWLVASRGPWPGRGILSGGPQSDATSHPKISNHLTTQPKVFPLALQLL
jgi:hypothetical protein